MACDPRRVGNVMRWIPASVFGSDTRGREFTVQVFAECIKQLLKSQEMQLIDSLMCFTELLRITGALCHADVILVLLEAQEGMFLKARGLTASCERPARVQTNKL